MDYLLMPADPANFGVVLTSLIFLYLLSRVIFNLYFHPLSRYSGPKLFAASGIPNLVHVLKATRAYKVSELHNKYGPIVRVSPNELSYVHEDAWKDIYSSHKAPGGAELQKSMPASPFRGIFYNPNDGNHRRIRKILSPGFSEKAIRERQDIIQRYVNLLIQRLRESLEKPVDILELFECIGADVSTRLAFGKSIDALEASKLPEIVTTSASMLKQLAKTQAMNQYLLSRLLNKFIGGDNRGNNAFFRVFVGQTLNRRMERITTGAQTGKDAEDFVSLLSQNYLDLKGLSEEELGVVCGDLLIAGADTGVIYHLLTNPVKLSLLAHEIHTAFTSESQIDLANVNTLNYANAVISETHRLFPSAPETVRRVTNPGGNMICGDLIPGGITVGVYHWAAGHYKGAWKDTDSFVPERWLGDKKYESDLRGVVNVFNTGPRNCIGQNLAMALLRLILVQIIWNFDLSLCEESNDWLDMGAYTLVYDKRPLMVKVKPVKR